MPTTYANAVVHDAAESVEGVVVDDQNRASLRFGTLTVQTHSALSREQQAAYWRRVADAAARIAIELGEAVPVGVDPAACSDAGVRA